MHQTFRGEGNGPEVGAQCNRPTLVNDHGCTRCAKSTVANLNHTKSEYTEKGSIEQPTISPVVKPTASDGVRIKTEAQMGVLSS